MKPQGERGDTMGEMRAHTDAQQAKARVRNFAAKGSDRSSAELATGRKAREHTSCPRTRSWAMRTNAHQCALNTVHPCTRPMLRTAWVRRQDAGGTALANPAHKHASSLAGARRDITRAWCLRSAHTHTESRRCQHRLKGGDIRMMRPGGSNRFASTAPPSRCGGTAPRPLLCA